jgi:hypothetical protein
MNEIEKRMFNNDWDLEIASRVSKVRRFRRNRNIAVGSGVLTLVLTLGITLSLTVYNPGSTSELINSQIYSTMTNTYSDYDSEETVDGYIMAVLAER